MRRRRLLFALGACTVLAGGAFVAYRVATQESTAPASVHAAVERFRASGADTLPAALRGRAPEPGVYVYATAGFERSEVLGSRHHAYPPRTTITVSPGGCGLRVRWDALATRWDAIEACPRGSGWRLAAQSASHEFVGHRDTRTYRCTAGSTFRPASLEPGTTWSSSCAIEGTTTAGRGVVVGPRLVTVAGEQVDTVLLRIRMTVNGDTSGMGTTLTWIVPATGLIVRRTVANASTTDTLVGDVAYVERVTLTLTSLRPLR